MASTTNFNWSTPDDTSLVKDGAAAIRTLGQSIDTSMAELKGGTTGQVLSKASNTDMDFTWATDASGIPATIFDAKGDIIAATAADTASRLAVGTNGQVLTADSTTATGLAWATASSGGMTYSDWTPSYGSITVGNGTVVAKYAQSGKFTHMFWRLDFGTTTSLTGAATVSLPVNAAYSDWGTTTLHIDATGRWPGYVYVLSNTAYLYPLQSDTAYAKASNNLGNYNPGTFDSSSWLAINLYYQAA